jgi:uncharacterized protein (DUF169 family)
MDQLTIPKIGDRLAEAFRFRTRPLAVYGSDSIPGDAVRLSEVDRCFAVSLYRMAIRPDIPAIYIGKDASDGCCPGGLSHTGFMEKPGYINYFVSTGKKDVRGGAAEHLKSSPEMAEKSFKAVGKITPPGKYLVVQACEVVPEKDPGVRSLCCFGSAEQIRNLAALVHFDRDDPFSPVIVPWGPSCATYITYPAGMAEHAPINTAFVGPQDPTQNSSIPPDTMAMGIPIEMARRMVENLPNSFVVLRPAIAFPDRSKRDRF